MHEDRQAEIDSNCDFFQHLLSGFFADLLPTPYPRCSAKNAVVRESASRAASSLRRWPISAAKP